ncbi:MAG: DUF2178 domain-containing protein [Alphaproteobacteria bacterium]|nr:MAG: DUF2178 domain-containing protein [Alphaproteobacteria bacterium]
MKQKQFRIVVFLIAMSVSAVLSFSFSTGNPALAVSVFFAGLVAIYLCKSRLEEVVEDERIRQVSQKASWVTYQIIVLSFAIGGSVLIAIRNDYPMYSGLGFFMANACCGILVLYGLLYMYYNREYGG